MVELCKAGDFQAIYDFDQAVSDFNKQVKGTFGIELLPYWDGSFDGHEEPQLPQEYYAFAECQELTKRSEPRKDFPTDFEEAYRWADVANNGAQDWERPIWRWDCGFKLDYDGPILRFNSRFYPPKAHYGDTWDGVVTVVLLGEEIHQEEFDCETLEDLKNAVQKYTEDYRQQLLQLLGKQ
jgi:hypothetical protein